MAQVGQVLNFNSIWVLAPQSNAVWIINIYIGVLIYAYSGRSIDLRGTHLRSRNRPPWCRMCTPRCGCRSVCLWTPWPRPTPMRTHEEGATVGAGALRSGICSWLLGDALDTSRISNMFSLCSRATYENVWHSAPKIQLIIIIVLLLSTWISNWAAFVASCGTSHTLSLSASFSRWFPVFSCRCFVPLCSRTYLAIVSAAPLQLILQCVRVCVFGFSNEFACGAIWLF